MTRTPNDLMAKNNGFLGRSHGPGRVASNLWNRSSGFLNWVTLFKIVVLVPVCHSFLGDLAQNPNRVFNPRGMTANLHHLGNKEARDAGRFSHSLGAGIAYYETEITKEMDDKNHQILDLVKGNKLLAAYQVICDVVADIEETENEHDLRKASRAIDQILQTFTSQAFLAPYNGQLARRRIMLGMDVLALQLSSSLAEPYNTIPKRVLLDALRALTVMNESQQPATHRGNTTSSFGIDSSFSSFRILQRLITGVGVRGRGRSGKYSNANLQEKDFNMVLNSFSNIGKMDMAHKVVALQERTENAPPLSPVTFSILLKGYGRLGDLRNVDMIVKQAMANEIFPDTIMLNSLIDAYVMCGATSKAKKLFGYMTNRNDGPSLGKSTQQWVAGSGSIPRANRRTYNTMLKGFAQPGSLKECLSLSQEMQEIKMWDSITTNTLVQAAVRNRNFTLAEALLSEYTARPRSEHPNQKKNGRHPNVEAYTDMLDGYSKAGELNKALDVMRTMKDRSVEPTEVTYTCLVAAFARQGQVDKAKKTMEYMSGAAGFKPGAVTYNAFISALLEGLESKSRFGKYPVADSTDNQVDEALRVFYSMMKAGISPNEVTISMIVLALGRCRPASRVEEAKVLVSRLENNGIINGVNREKVITALVQACGQGGDMQGVLESFKKLRRPDLVAVNTFLDACCRCKNVEAAMKTFQHLFEKRGQVSLSSSLNPDVITFSILICALLRKDTLQSSTEAQRLYESMKTEYNAFPDNTMVDQVLKTIIRCGNLQKKDVHLIASIVRDAETLKWRPNQLERRKRAIQDVLGRRSGVLDVWGDEDDDILRQEVKSEDVLFKRKGWNSVDSGFRLWGGGKMDIRLEGEGNDAEDDFLQSKGWNNVDSGFRIF